MMTAILQKLLQQTADRSAILQATTVSALPTSALARMTFCELGRAGNQRPPLQNERGIH